MRELTAEELESVAGGRFDCGWFGKPKSDCGDDDDDDDHGYGRKCRGDDDDDNGCGGKRHWRKRHKGCGDDD